MVNHSEDIEHHHHAGNKSTMKTKFIVDFLLSKSLGGYPQQTSPYYYELTYTLPDFCTGFFYNI